MKTLITGINGFVGTVLHRELIKKNYEVFGIDLIGNNENIFSANIADKEKIHKIMNDISPDYIFHLAAISHVNYNDAYTIYEINQNGTLNLLSSSIKLTKKPRILIVSSSQVYGNVDQSKQPIDENNPISPVNHYGASKAGSENVAKVFFYEHDLPVIIARPFNHLGKGQRTDFVVSKITDYFANNKKEISLGNIDTIRDFLDVRDVVRAYIQLIENAPAGEIFNIASGEGYKISDIIKILEDITEKKIKITKNDNLMRKKEIFCSIGNASKLKRFIEWAPIYNIKETLQWMIDKSN